MGFGTGELRKGHGEVDLARDRELVERCQAGDASAFNDLYLRYFDRLYRYCLRRVGVPAEAEDIAQEAFTRAWRALPNFAGERRFYPWLSVIASNLCTDTLRNRSRTTPVAEMDEMMVPASDGEGCEDAVMRAADTDLLSMAFSRLSERHQQVLHMREGSGWSYQRIAEHEGVRVSTVETVLWRARQALKREFISLAGTEGGLVALLLQWARLARTRLARTGGTARAAASAPRAPAIARASAARPSLPASRAFGAIRLAAGGTLASSVAALLVIATATGPPPSSISGTRRAPRPAATQTPSPTAAHHPQQLPRLVLHGVPTTAATHSALAPATTPAGASRSSGTALGATVTSAVPGALSGVMGLLGGGARSARSTLAGVPQLGSSLLGGGTRGARSTLAGVPQLGSSLPGGGARSARSTLAGVPSGAP